jgi:hypothetical protein
LPYTIGKAGSPVNENRVYGHQLPHNKLKLYWFDLLFVFQLNLSRYVGAAQAPWAGQ